MLLVILGLIFFIGLVMIHELGHFVAARKSGVTVEEYGLGFPPKIYGKKLGKHQTEYTINALPLGGFVKLKGEHDMDTEPGSFGGATLPQKLIIIAAGVLMNLATALVLLTILAFVGIPHLIPNQYTVPSDTKVIKDDLVVAGVFDETPAKAAGLQQFDRISSITAKDDCTQDCTVFFNADNSVADKEELLKSTTNRFQGKTVTVEYWRQENASAQKLDVKLRTQAEVDAIVEANKSASVDDQKAPGFMGIEPYRFQVTRHTWSAPIVAAGVSKQLIVLTLQGLGDIVTGLSKGDTQKATQNVSGPVGIFFILKDGSVLGFGYIVMVIAVISLTLALMNVLPIPALDGGRLFIILLFHGLSKLRQRVQGKPLLLKQQTEDRIHGTGFVVMMLLFVLITFVDIKRFF